MPRPRRCGTNARQIGRRGERVELRSYQKAGAAALVRAKRAVLADEPGLGKSAQALVASEPPLLIVAPGHTHGVWEDEIQTWYSEEVEPARYVGTRRKKIGLAGHEVVLTNYASLDEVLRPRWDTVIFDEAHTLRNRQARTLFKTVRGRLRTKQAFFLTGSPIFEHAGDLWPLLYLIDRRRWPSYWAYVEQFAFVSVNDFGWSVEGARNIPALRASVSDVVIQRTYDMVKRELPPLRRMKYRLEMSQAQAKAYKDLRDEMLTELADGGLLLAPSELAVMTRLRQLLVTPRLIGIEDTGAALTALQEEAYGKPRPLVIFTPFTEAIPYIWDALAEAGYEVLEQLKGGMPPDAMTYAQRAFLTARERAKAIIAQVRLGTGWNANVAHEAFFVGMDWSAPVHDQAERRLRRDGQKHPVLARYFIHTGTIEEDQLEILGGKKRIADLIMNLRK